MGVNDHVIAETADAILVAHEDAAQNVLIWMRAFR